MRSLSIIRDDMCPALSVFKQHMRKFLFKAGAFLFDVIQSLAGTCFLCCRTYCKLEVVNIVDVYDNVCYRYVQVSDFLYLAVFTGSFFFSVGHPSMRWTDALVEAAGWRWMKMKQLEVYGGGLCPTVDVPRLI